MANRYPYISSAGPLTQAVAQLRKSFPSVVDSDLLKKLGLASNNECYLINIIRFLGLIDKEGKKSPEKAKIFVLHDSSEFQNALAELVKNAYSDFFDIRGEDAWLADRASLITFFRQSDESTELVGERQANTFATLASLAGKRPPVSSAQRGERPNGSSKTRPPRKPKEQAASTKPSGRNAAYTEAPSAAGTSTTVPQNSNSGGMALAVRVEINLPAQADQETYDRIFRSLRTNLIDVPQP